MLLGWMSLREHSFISSMYFSSLNFVLSSYMLTMQQMETLAVSPKQDAVLSYAVLTLLICERLWRPSTLPFICYILSRIYEHTACCVIFLYFVFFSNWNYVSVCTNYTFSSCCFFSVTVNWPVKSALSAVCQRYCDHF